MATFVHEGKSIDYTPTSAVTAGDVIVLGTLVGVAPRSIEANKLGALQVEGVFDFPKATGSSSAISAGDKVYWDAAEEVATKTSSSNTYLGKAVADAAATAAEVRVKLAPQG